MTDSDVDRGWAWLIIPSSFVMNFLTSGMPWAASGAYNVVFLQAFPQSSAATVAWASSLTSAVSYFVGPVAGILISIYGLRVPAFLGGIIAASGYILSSFAPNVEFLIFSFGILTGVGLGIAHVSGGTAIAHYFKKYLGLAVGISSAGTGVGMFAMAPFITAVDHVYGWRGSLIIVGGVCLNICVCAFILRNRNKTLKKDRASVLDLSLFRMFTYQLLIANNVIVAFGISIVFVHLMAFAKFGGYSDTKSAMLISTIGLASIAGRFSLSAVTKFPFVNVCTLYSVCFILCGVFASLYPLFNWSYPALLALSVGFGVFTASYGSILSILLVEMVGVDRYANSYGYMLLMEGIGQMLGGPFAGFLFDVTGSYDASLYVGGAALIVGGVIPLFSLCCGKTPAEEECVTRKEDVRLPSNSAVHLDHHLERTSTAM